MANPLFSAGAFLNTGSQPLNPPLTQTASAHAVTIRSAIGTKIGRIQSWSVQLARTTDQIFEVSVNATGEPVELVPQIQPGNSIQIERYELYSSFLGEAFGVSLADNKTDMYSLIQQVKPINIRETYLTPSGGLRAYVYIGCYFTDMGRTIAAEDDRIVKARATITFTRILRLN